MSAIAAAAQPVPTNPRARLIIVDGIIGAGKTELCRALAASLRSSGLVVSLALEPVDRWSEVGILEAFYADRARYGYSFQTFAFATRIKAIADAVRATPAADVYILERSPATDRIFMELQRGLVPPVEMAMYAEWCAAYESMLPIDLSKATVIFLKPQVETCMARQLARARSGESASMEAYQRVLQRAHEAFFLGDHADEFPHMCASPFPRSSVVVLGAHLADLDFKNEGAEKETVVWAARKLIGL